ncbi:MAG: GNAT family N-acetyltransferase [Candidatus Hodarchaeales archaeon]
MSQIDPTNSKLDKYNRSLFLFESAEKAVHQLTEFFNRLFQLNQIGVKGVIASSDSSFISQLQRNIRNIKFFPQVEFTLMNQINAYLGSTLDFIVMDLRTIFSPNSLISMVETVQGGGLIVIIGNERKIWVKSVNKDYLPYSTSSHLLDWFLSNISKNSGCLTGTEETHKLISFFSPMPFGVNLTKNTIGIPVSSNQNEMIENLVSDLNRNNLLINTDIIIADRGRGKSAAVGLSIAKIILEDKQSKSKIIITAKDISHTQTIFEFISRGLTINNIKHRLKKDMGQTNGIEVSKGCNIEFRWVSDLTRDLKCSILIVDEAAAFPQEKLLEIVGLKAKKVFISTIHGYEGAGRSFQYKILNHIKRRYKDKYRILRLTEPIRYLIEDPIESLMNETFFLKLERGKIESYDQFNAKNETSFVTYPDSSELFSNENLSLLEEMMGILIYAHYRNQPNDLLLIADSNQHFLANLSVSDSKGNKQILLACQLAKEGIMDSETVNSIIKGKFIDGNLIPSIAIRHFSSIFAQLRGIRIVRIASHPDFTNKGFGRVAIEEILKKYQSQDWIGVSCGATMKLVKFWRKFGFKIIHIRPTKSTETGEWNIVLIYPISETAKQLVNQASRNFALQFIYLLRHSLFDLKPELAILILRSCTDITDYQLKMTQSGKYRLKRYIEGNLNFLLTVDVLQELVVSYFVVPLELKLSPSQELVLMSRILQGRTWGQTLHKTGLKWKEANGLLQKAILRIANQMIISES